MVEWLIALGLLGILAFLIYLDRNDYQVEGRHISRVFFKGEQYVSFYEVIKVIRDIGDDFCEQDLHEACGALEWVAEQLQFSMIADGIKYE